MLPNVIQTEDKSLVRDMHSKALLCTDKGALERHRRQLVRTKQHGQLEHRVEALQDEVEKLRELVTALLSHHGT